MTREVIPQSVRIHCDLCGVGVGLEENTIVLGGSAVENKTPIGPAYMTGKYDLCTTCYNKVTGLLRVLS